MMPVIFFTLVWWVGYLRWGCVDAGKGGSRPLVDAGRGEQARVAVPLVVCCCSRGQHTIHRLWIVDWWLMVGTVPRWLSGACSCCGWGCGSRTLAA